jgi:putative iron-only hydrogenase system regulator
MSANESPNLSETLSTAYTIRIITRRHTMDTRIALIGVLLETRESVDKLNHLLSDYGEYVIGRMGLPYKEKGIHIISIAVDAPNNIISALSGKLGMLPGVSTKTIYGKTT